MIDDFRPQGPTKPADSLKPTQTNTNTEPATPFKTPDQVGQLDAPFAVTTTADGPLHEKPRGTGHHWFNLPWPPSRLEIVITIMVLAVVFFGCALFLKLHPTAASEPTKTVTAVTKKKVELAPTTVASTLSGLQVSPDVNQRPAVGVMVENSKDARPQAGLSQAGVVFEAVAEGGITRFLAIFQDQQPGSVGPIRSARPYYVQWNEGFRAAYAHVGGSPDALNDIKSWNVQDLNQFYNSAPYHRVTSRPAPHNMYAAVADLADLAAKKGFSSPFTGFARKTASPAAQPNATSIDLQISSALYNPHYAYDAKTNTYARSEGGAPQTDSNTGGQLAPNVVIAITVPLSSGTLDAQKSAYSNYNPIGSGAAYIFQDGSVTTGTWNKSSNTAQISFTDANGAVIKLNPGQTWISAVPSGSKVVYH